MCGSLQLSSKEKAIEILVGRNSRIPINNIQPTQSREYDFSDHRFIRQEKLNWWINKLGLSVLKPIRIIQVNKFREFDKTTGRLIEFSVPQNYNLRAIIHPDLTNGRPVLSIVTVNSEIPVKDPVVEVLRQKVMLVHHRMPLLVKAA